MPRAGHRGEPKLLKVAIRLNESDWRWLQRVRFRGEPSQTIRALLAEYRARFEATERDAADVPLDLGGL